MTKTYAVVGDPIDHSLSPNIHTAAFKALNMDCVYIACKILKDDLDASLGALKEIQISGFNVTIPHKISIMKYLDETDESCSVIGAANTIVINDDKTLRGYNTDMDGFLEPFKKKNLPIKDSNVLLLGAGGAARAIVAAFAKECAGHISIANRNIANAESLSEFSKTLGLKATPFLLDDVKDSAKEYNIIVNATPIGLKNEPSPISFEGIGKDTIVYDIVYLPMNTDFIWQAREKKATIIYGYEMLLGQACRSFEIWHDMVAPYNAMKRSLLGGV
ncbi:MAG: shikimate dehydrogenase [Thaumarchaeota archaeon]|nr:shikimate dehydrogenase [Nitrososphaerota archaeon]